MKLHYSDVLMPRKVCALARHLQSPLEFIYVDLGRGENRSPAFIALNPDGKVPVLEDGARIVTESNAIMCHLALKAGSDLWPSGDDRKVDVIRWMSWNDDRFTRYGGALYFEFVIKRRFSIGPPDKTAVDAATGAFRASAAILDDHLKARDFLVGDTLTVADFATAVTLPYAVEAHIPIDEFPAVRRWHDRLSQLGAWREPFPRQTAAAA